MTSSNIDMPVLEHAPLNDLFLNEGQELAAYCAGPIALQDSASIWFVAEGTADLFTPHLTETGQPDGLRRHVLTAEAGDILLGGEVGDGQRRLGLVLSGNVHTRLFRLNAARLFEDGALAPDLQVALDRWISRLSEVLSDGQQRKPVVQGPVTAGPLQAGESYAGTKSVQWVQADKPLTLCDMTEISPEGQWFPIVERCWNSAQDTAQLTVRRFAELDMTRDIGPGLRLFQTQAMRGLADRIGRLESRARDQQDRRREQDAALLSRSFGDAVEVSRRAQPLPRPVGSEGPLAEVVGFGGHPQGRSSGC